MDFCGIAVMAFRNIFHDIRPHFRPIVVVRNRFGGGFHSRVLKTMEQLDYELAPVSGYEWARAVSVADVTKNSGSATKIVVS